MAKAQTDLALRDEIEIKGLVCRERLWRDTSQWDRALSAYVPGAYVRTTWFAGTVEEYFRQSREQHPQGALGMHPIWPCEVRLNRDRATVESMAEIRLRRTIEQVQLDITTECRFFSRVQRRGGVWKLSSLEAIYVRDRITTAAQPGEIGIDWEQLARYRQSYRALSYLHAMRGQAVDQDLIGDDRPDLLAAFYHDANEWLTSDEPSGRPA